jgi:hypothetical protein
MHHVQSTLFTVCVMLYSYLTLQLQDQNDNTAISQQDRAPAHFQTEICAYLDKTYSMALAFPKYSTFSP